MSGELTNVGSAIRFGMNPTPLGAAGLALGIGSSLFGGKGGAAKPVSTYRLNNGMYEQNTGYGFHPMYNAPKAPPVSGLNIMNGQSTPFQQQPQTNQFLKDPTPNNQNWMLNNSIAQEFDGFKSKNPSGQFYAKALKGLG